MQSDLDLELADGLLADYLYSWSGEYEIRKIVIVRRSVFYSMFQIVSQTLTILL